jgi:hypothetical protein
MADQEFSIQTMKVQSAPNGAYSVAIAISANADITNAQEAISFVVVVEGLGANPGLAELQNAALRRVRDVIAENMKSLQRILSK